MPIVDPIWMGQGLTLGDIEESIVRAEKARAVESVDAVRFEMKIWADGQASDADGNPLDTEGNPIIEQPEQPEPSEQES